jgi:hypothetical protein
MSCVEECLRQNVKSRVIDFLTSMLRRGCGTDARTSPKAKAFLETGDMTAILGRGQLYTFDMPRGCRIFCDKGTVWVTRADRFCDYILQQGESLLLRGTGKIIISGSAQQCLIRIAEGLYTARAS